MIGADHAAWHPLGGPCVCPVHRPENERHLPRAAEPDLPTFIVCAGDGRVLDVIRPDEVGSWDEAVKWGYLAWLRDRGELPSEPLPG